jgi:hypothetical protein
MPCYPFLQNNPYFASMKIRLLFIVLMISFITGAFAQNQSFEYVQKGEFGITAGLAHYFGDINTRSAINKPKIAAGIFFRKQFGNYVGLRLSAHYAQLGYSDIYSKNEYQKQRNLSFNTNIWEVALQGDFNFFKFIPQNPDYMFTPYITLGVGAFTYDPYAYLYGTKQFLRPLGTEGQAIGYKGRKTYSTLGICFPVGVGFKYNLSEKINFSFELSHRFTTTDYIDDVSTTYIGVGRFAPSSSGGLSTAALLQDRSYELDPANVIGTEGRQRGFAKQKDQYIIAEVGFSFNISTYKCPTAN